MRYIHDGKLRNRTVEPPKVFVFDEPKTTGRTNTALRKATLFGETLAKQRKTESSSVLAGHDHGQWRWTND